ncbi:hypothetical protein M0Q28_02290 [Patescibacteria group bacterium]|jgi:hypothetical protein|nr:hypothetical protein [Patescibacteria group bacterium]
MSLPSRLIVECPLCHASYQQEAVRALGETTAGKLFHCSCGTCGRSMMALMRENTGYVSTIGLVTDQTVNDAIRLADRTPISADECIGAHVLLEGESQDFLELLQK